MCYIHGICLLHAPHVLKQFNNQPALFPAVSLIFLNKTGIVPAQCHCNSLPHTSSKDALCLLGDGNLASNWTIFRKKKIQSASFLKRCLARNGNNSYTILNFSQPVNVVITETVSSVRSVYMYIRHAVFNVRISALLNRSAHKIPLQPILPLSSSNPARWHHIHSFLSDALKLRVYLTYHHV